MPYKNETNIELPLAVWLASGQDYDLIPDPNVISATALQRPLRSLVLSRRLLVEAEIDIDTLIPAKLGSSVHYSAEMAWKNNYAEAMRNLGYPENVIERTVVNPKTPKMYGADTIDVYIEQRTNKEIDGFIVSGKYDFVIDGELHDIKTTKTYSYITGSSEGDYRLQGSIYRWLNPEIVLGDHVHINYLFTDWSPLRAAADTTYPRSRCLVKKLQLHSIPETEQYIRDRLAAIRKHELLPQSGLPQCSMKELWQELPRWAVYKNPEKTQRATRVFDLEQDAMTYNATSCKGAGMIVKREGEVKRCHFCEARPVCTQAESMQLQGILKV